MERGGVGGRPTQHIKNKKLPPYSPSTQKQFFPFSSRQIERMATTGISRKRRLHANICRAPFFCRSAQKPKSFRLLCAVRY